MSSRPRILVVGLELHWPGSARLPRALQEAGVEVGVACRANALLAHTKFRDRFFLLPKKIRGRHVLARIREIGREWRPDHLLPLDDVTVLFLSRVHEHLLSRDKSN